MHDSIVAEKGKFPSHFKLDYFQMNGEIKEEVEKEKEKSIRDRRRLEDRSRRRRKKQKL
jgi:hypothetical protein